MPTQFHDIQPRKRAGTPLPQRTAAVKAVPKPSHDLKIQPASDNWNVFIAEGMKQGFLGLHPFILFSAFTAGIILGYRSVSMAAAFCLLSTAMEAGLRSIKNNGEAFPLKDTAKLWLALLLTTSLLGISSLLLNQLFFGISPYAWMSLLLGALLFAAGKNMKPWFTFLGSVSFFLLIYPLGLFVTRPHWDRVFQPYLDGTLFSKPAYLLVSLALFGAITIPFPTLLGSDEKPGKKRASFWTEAAVKHALTLCIVLFSSASFHNMVPIEYLTAGYFARMLHPLITDSSLAFLVLTFTSSSLYWGFRAWKVANKAASQTRIAPSAVMASTVCFSLLFTMLPFGLPEMAVRLAGLIGLAVAVGSGWLVLALLKQPLKLSTGIYLAGALCGIAVPISFAVGRIALG